VAGLACATLALVTCGGFLLVQRAAGAADAPACRIEFLDLKERLRRQNADVDELELASPPCKYRRFTAAEADNPVLFRRHCAVVRVENTTGHPCTFYRLRMEFNRGLEAYHAFLVQVDVRAADEDVPSEIPLSDPEYADRTGQPLLPTVDLLQRIKAPTITVPPGESIEVPISSILSWRSNRQRGLRPATYCVCVTLHYVEAPGGEGRQITSPPVDVTVTEEHIRVAEAFWKNFRQ
jgi:hypothetical protein